MAFFEHIQRTVGKLFSQQQTSTLIKNKEITILFGSESGNAEFIARETERYLNSKKIKASSRNMSRYSAIKLANEAILLVVVSTHGEGDPPESAARFYNDLFQSDMPGLTGLKYAVCALGDSSYTNFCQTGKHIDKRLNELGAERLFARTDCDAEFRDKAISWISSVYKLISYEGKHVCELQVEEDTTVTGRKWYDAQLIDKYPLYNEKADKECWHLSFRVRDSDFSYEPGDCIGILPGNDPEIVQNLLRYLGYSGNEDIETVHGTTKLHEALLRLYELTTLSGSLLNRYAVYTQNVDLHTLISDQERLNEYVKCNDVLDLVQDFQSNISPDQFIRLLSPIKPRLYSISSSLKVMPNQTDITVRSVKHVHRNRLRKGACSTPLCDLLSFQDTTQVFVKKNPNFRLPVNSSAPVIMIGTGTGIAPFRAFLQERTATNSNGKSWLFFGDRNCNDGFLYQNELGDFLEKGILSKLSIVFSREGGLKTYVQHSIGEYGNEVMKWVDEGAYIYVCGLKRMAVDVKACLIQILMSNKRINYDMATEFIDHLRRERRYCEDVY